MYEFDAQLRLPYEDKLNALVNTPEFRQLSNGQVAKNANKIRREGNRAAHDTKPPSHHLSTQVASALWHLLRWVVFTYGTTKPDPTSKFDPQRLPSSARTLAERQQALTRTKAEREALESKLEHEVQATADARRQAEELAKSVEQLETERAQLIAQVAAAKKAAEQTVPDDAVDWTELETRQFLIDELLKEAGWAPEAPDVREHPVTGMPNGSGTGYVDYVLWGDDGKPLAIIEAKRTLVAHQSGQQQAKLYANCLETKHGQRPIIFTSNGYEHWVWDDQRYPPRAVQGFLTADELKLAIQRRTTAKPLADVEVSKAIAGRYYQERAIRAITEHLDVDRQRKALLVMATGAGKTRTIIALSDLLQRANWVKRVLFLADRTELVRQAVNAFKQHLPDSSPVNLVTEPNEDGRVLVSTYQTMINKLEELRPDGTRRFGVGHFDLVVIDEAHRSVYNKYRGIFSYFDSLLVGLTATPKDEVDANTYDLFDLETGVPTNAYELDDAISDGYLVPPRGISVPLKFMREGLRYDERSPEEQAAWDEADWGTDEDGNPLDAPDEVSAAALNRFLFNADTVDRVLAQLMANGIKVAGGDRLGKTIIFAKSQRHADFIYERFIASYPHLDNGNFARVITHGVTYADTLIDDFKHPEKAPHIAISVDMLDTGIDVPEVVNLVFFKLVRSKTKFWQMLGRGTRLRPDLFAPGEDKTEFLVFDFCQNLEYFSQDLQDTDGASSRPLSERLIHTRLDLVREMDDRNVFPESRMLISEQLRVVVDSMNVDNVLVRPHRQHVERFAGSDAWQSLNPDDFEILRDRIARLPDQLAPEKQETKRFDLLLLTAQLARLRGELFERQRELTMRIAATLETKDSIPAVAQQMELIQAVQDDVWWTDVTHAMLEEVRLGLRHLVPLIERTSNNPVYSDFTDEEGDAVEIELPGTGGAVGSTEFRQFRKKAEHFLKEHMAEEVVAKVRSGQPLTPADLEDLQRILVAADIGDDATFAEASERAGNLGSFVRRLVGLDREAAKAAFADFLDDKRYSRAQIDFVNLIIDELTRHGEISPARIYESPYTGMAPEGPETIFTNDDLDRLFATIETFANREKTN